MTIRRRMRGVSSPVASSPLDEAIMESAWRARLREPLTIWPHKPRASHHRAWLLVLRKASTVANRAPKDRKRDMRQRDPIPTARHIPDSYGDVVRQQHGEGTPNISATSCPGWGPWARSFCRTLTAVHGLKRILRRDELPALFIVDMHITVAMSYTHPETARMPRASLPATGGRVRK